MPLTVHPFVPQSASAVPVEVQWLNSAHCLHEMPAHAHAFYELILVTGGRGVHRVGADTFDASAGTLFLIAPQLVHDGRGLGSATGWVVLFEADAAQAPEPHGLASPGGRSSSLLFDAFRDAAALRPEALLLDGDTLGRVVDSVERMALELQARPFGYGLAVRSLMQLMLLEVARHARRVGVIPPRVDGVTRSTLIAKVFADIDSHFSQRSELRDAGRRLGLSAGHLTTTVKRETGRTYGEWLIERRMMEARRLLCATDKPVADIAAEVGYAEVASFQRRFRQHHGKTPAHWRAAQSSAGDSRDAEIRTRIP